MSAFVRLPAVVTETRERLEADIRRLCLKQDFAGATTAALRGYGPEIYGFLLGFHKREDDAAEVFSLFSEKVWRGLPGFDWASSFRTWAYTIARNTSIRYRGTAVKRAKRFPGLPDGSFLDEIAEGVRSGTKSYLKTEAKDRVARLRESLSDEDQMLLALRVDRKLAWLDLARVLRDDATAATAEELNRESAKLRKRYQVIKDKLVELNRKGGEPAPKN